MMKERLHEIREKALAQINSTDSLEKLKEFLSWVKRENLQKS